MDHEFRLLVAGAGRHHVLIEFDAGTPLQALQQTTGSVVDALSRIAGHRDIELPRQRKAAFAELDVRRPRHQVHAGLLQRRGHAFGQGGNRSE